MSNILEQEAEDLEIKRLTVWIVRERIKLYLIVCRRWYCRSKTRRDMAIFPVPTEDDGKATRS